MANFIDEIFGDAFQGASKKINKVAKMGLFLAQAAIIMGAEALIAPPEENLAFVPQFSDIEKFQPKPR